MYILYIDSNSQNYLIHVSIAQIHTHTHTHTHIVCPENIQPCNIKNRDIY